MVEESFPFYKIGVGTLPSLIIVSVIIFAVRLKLSLCYRKKIYVLQVSNATRSRFKVQRVEVKQLPR